MSVPLFYFLSRVVRRPVHLTGLMSSHQAQPAPLLTEIILRTRITALYYSSMCVAKAVGFSPQKTNHPSTRRVLCPPSSVHVPPQLLASKIWKPYFPSPSSSHPRSRSEAEKMSLAEWAKQLGRSDILSALKERSQVQNEEEFASGGIGKEENQGTKGVVETGGGERSGGDADNGQTEAGSKSMATDHTGMFVEELRVRTEFLSTL